MVESRTNGGCCSLCFRVFSSMARRDLLGSKTAGTPAHTHQHACCLPRHARTRLLCPAYRGPLLTTAKPIRQWASSSVAAGWPGMLPGASCWPYCGLKRVSGPCSRRAQSAHQAGRKMTMVLEVSQSLGCGIIALAAARTGEMSESHVPPRLSSRI